ncbi:MAG: Holliday junction branch migration protein RuvA [Clostridium sp.]|jgi:Holliday junction DNA helicase RuvA|nr:Holliday junction branch migration protein RuvA [Clostridium sp.]
MFYSISGKVIHVDAQGAAIETGGVAFRLLCPRGVLGGLRKGEQALLYTHLLVRDDALELCGFSSVAELDAFKLLLGVTGVGAKVALGILSELSPDRLALCVAASDSKSIQSAPGVGAKLAQRIVLELKGKLSAFSVDTAESFAAIENVGSSAGGEALEALCALGYSRAQAAQALAGMESSLPADALIRQALRLLNG